MEKKPLKECNGSREAVYIQTRYYFVSFAKNKYKQTNKQINRKNVDRDTATAVANYSGLGYLYKKNPRNIKKHSDTRKTTAIYNKLLNETRDQHYYILNR